MSARNSAKPIFDDALAVIGENRGIDEVQATGRVTEFIIGNGLVTTRYLTDLLTQAHHEVLFSTCFWAQSPSLSNLHDALITLNNRARQIGRRITVRILFSSYSFAQKFLSFKGVRKWKSSTWEKLGLPDPSLLDCLDLTVLSRFRKPFGVMHAKFVIIDRAIVVLPSCNISWENWYELAVRLEGDIVQPFLQYFFYYYHPTKGTIPPCDTTSQEYNTTLHNEYPSLHYAVHSTTGPIAFLACGLSRSGAFPFAPIRANPTLFQLEAIRRARRTIFIQTPNLNSRAIIKALKYALLNSIEVTICIPKNMMVLESLVTGWSTTKCCVTLLRRWARRRPETNLNVQWFRSDGSQPFVVDGDKSHIKFMVVDEELVVVGSSNLDRASACTSGEVNVAVPNSEFAHQILAAVMKHQGTGLHRRESL